MSVTVRDVMTARVVMVNRSVSFKEIAASLKRYHVSAFPVVDVRYTVIGVVSGTDLLPKEALAATGGPKPGVRHRKDRSKACGLTAGDLMTSPAVTITPDEPVTHAAQLMYSRKIKQLPVVDAASHLVGIVSRSDVLSVYGRSDTDIRQEIQDKVILEHTLTDPGRFVVIVDKGIVTLYGKPETTGNGHEIAAEMWHVDGVVAVRDRLTYPPATRADTECPGYFDDL
jgi:CBS domain-containing protein